MLDRIYIRLLACSCIMLEPPHWRLPNIQSAFWRFYMNDGGGASIEYAEQQYALQANRCYFIPAGTRFSTHLQQRVFHFYIHFDLLGLPYQAEREIFMQPICLPQTEALEPAVRALRDELQQRQGVDLLLQFRAKAILYTALVLHLQRIPQEQIQRCLPSMNAFEAIWPALQYIDSHLATPLSSRDLAKVCHMNTDYFIRRFRQSTGRTPVQYIQEQRIKRAEQQLLMTTESIEQVAAENGFGSRYYFTRVFKEHTGVSPAAYRKGLCGG